MRSPSETTISFGDRASCAAPRRCARVVGADEQAARALEDVAEFLAGEADGRRVDERLDLVDVVGDDAEEQRLVAVVQRVERDVAFEIVRQLAELVSMRSACAFIVSTCAGNSPRKPSASRSLSVKAVPLLSSGSRSSAIPCGISSVVDATAAKFGMFMESTPAGSMITGRHRPKRDGKPVVHWVHGREHAKFSVIQLGFPAIGAADLA